LIAFLHARTSRVALAVGFFLLALTLQAEFAYAVFFLIPLFLAIPWIRQKYSWKDFLASGLSIGVTLLPQLLFELRNKWIMTHSLLAAVRNPDLTVEWLTLWKARPIHLFHATKELFVGRLPWGSAVIAVILVFLLAACWSVLRKKNTPYKWKIIGIFTVIPYIFFMFWRGNYGNFFPYYLTPHFIFLIPFLMYGTQTAPPLPKFLRPLLSKDSIVAALGGVLVFSIWFTIAGRIFFPQNRAGLAIMQSAVDQLYHWQKTDEGDQGTFRVYTPNAQTEHYDYLIHAYAKKHNQPVPDTIKRAEDEVWYLLMEPDHAIEQRFSPWYKEATAGGVLVREQNIGILKLEAWMSAKKASESGFLLSK